MVFCLITNHLVEALDSLASYPGLIERLCAVSRARCRYALDLLSDGDSVSVGEAAGLGRDPKEDGR